MTRPWNWPGSPWRWRLILKDPRISVVHRVRRDASFILQSRPLKQMAAPRSNRVDAWAGKYPVLLQGGDLAGPGVAAGPVCVVADNLDVLQFPTGAVLVTAFPHPSWGPPLEPGGGARHRPGRDNRPSGQRGPGVRHPGPVQHRGSYGQADARRPGDGGRRRPGRLRGPGRGTSRPWPAPKRGSWPAPRWGSR